MKKRPPFLLFLAVVASSALALTVSAEAPASTPAPIYSLVPREGKGLGTLSAYGGVTTVFAPDAAGVDGIDIPNTDKPEVNLIWTFWRHKQPASDFWPAGPGARSTFTLRAETDTTLVLRIRLRVSDNWTDMTPASPVTLAAGKPVVISLPLASPVPAGSVQVIRVRITSAAPIPALRVTDWSVSEQK